MMHETPASTASIGGGGVGVRLPPVSMMPRDEHDQSLLQPLSSGMNNMRRVSLSDPFLHAYPQQSAASTSTSNHVAASSSTSSSTVPTINPNSPSTSIDPHRQPHHHAQQQPHDYSGRSRRDDATPQPHPPHDSRELISPRPVSPTESYYSNNAPPLPGTTSAPTNYTSNYAPSYPPQAHLNHQQPVVTSGEFIVPTTSSAAAHQQLGPTSNYRFGGPSSHGPPGLHGPPSSAAGGAQEPTSYFDYSMRRHSLSNSNGPPAHANGAQSHVRRISGESIAAGSKRKSSGEDSTMHEPIRNGPPASNYGYPQQGFHPASAPGLGNGFIKRRGSSLTYDKMVNLTLAEQQARRDSGMSSQSNLSPWEDDRRGSGGSWTSIGSYSMAGYSTDPYDQKLSGHSNHHHGVYESPRNSIVEHDGQQVGYGGRRPSIGINQLVQGGGTNVYPSSSNFNRPNIGGAGGGGMLPPVAHSPPDENDLASPTHVHAHVPTSRPSLDSHHSFSGPPVAPASGPWRSNSTTSLPETRRDSRQDSIGSLGAGGEKDSPYARSPELRVTHKLAERKRRKEMAQLFEDLKDSLPVDRQLKSSKWEILSKAIDFIDQLKATNAELGKENARLKAYVGVGMGHRRHPSSLSVQQHPQQQEDQFDRRSSGGGMAPPQQQMMQQEQQQQHYQTHSRHQSDYTPQQQHVRAASSSSSQGGHGHFQSNLGPHQQPQQSLHPQQQPQHHQQHSRHASIQSVHSSSNSPRPMNEQIEQGGFVNKDLGPSGVVDTGVENESGMVDVTVVGGVREGDVGARVDQVE